MTPARWLLEQDGAAVIREFLTPTEIAALQWIANIIYADMDYDASQHPKLEFNQPASSDLSI